MFAKLLAGTDPICLVGVTSHYHQVYPSRAVRKADSPRPLLRAPQEPAVGIDAFLAEHRKKKIQSLDDKAEVYVREASLMRS